MVTNISVATSEKWTDKNTGEQKEQTDWHRISFFGRLAEVAAQYLTKGSSVYIEGKIKTRKWTDKDNIDRYTTEIQANSLQMLGSKGQSNNTSNQTDSYNNYNSYNGGNQGGQQQNPNAGQGYTQAQAPRGQANNSMGYNSNPQPPVGGQGFNSQQQPLRTQPQAQQPPQGQAQQPLQGQSHNSPHKGNKHRKASIIKCLRMHRNKVCMTMICHFNLYNKN